jgi:pimeloyl-ACP methyl ester carboxylesterase
MTWVLLPGFDGTGRLFAPLRSGFPAGTNVVVGNYPADGPQDELALMAHARRFLPTDEPYVLIAESFSGPLAVQLAAECPPGLRALVLVGSFAHFPRGPLAAASLRQLARLPIMERPMPAALARLALVGHLASAEVLDLLRTAQASVPAETLRQRLQTLLTYDATTSVPALSVPLLYLQAKHDRLVPKRAARDFPPAAVIRLLGPHLLLQTNPDGCLAAISGWLGEVVEKNPPAGEPDGGIK